MASPNRDSKEPLQPLRDLVKAKGSLRNAWVLRRAEVMELLENGMAVNGIADVLKEGGTPIPYRTLLNYIHREQGKAGKSPHKPPVKSEPEREEIRKPSGGPLKPGLPDSNKFTLGDIDHGDLI